MPVVLNCMVHLLCWTAWCICCAELHGASVVLNCMVHLLYLLCWTAWCICCICCVELHGVFVVLNCMVHLLCWTARRVRCAELHGAMSPALIHILLKRCARRACCELPSSWSCWTEWCGWRPGSATPPMWSPSACAPWTKSRSSASETWSGGHCSS